MDTTEFEQLIEGAAETPHLDFKKSCMWSLSYARDIMAMSNLQDGGHVVIGIGEGQPLVREGLDPRTDASYDIERMRDQMSAFSDPHVQFEVFHPKDDDGKQYVVIRVHEFREIPVICRKDGADTKAATIYYRNSNRRVESAAISNYHDLRTLLDLAAAKLMGKYRNLGFEVDDSLREKLDEELSGL